MLPVVYVIGMLDVRIDEVVERLSHLSLQLLPVLSSDQNQIA
jgi:hypothetical protein